LEDWANKRHERAQSNRSRSNAIGASLSTESNLRTPPEATSTKINEIADLRSEESGPRENTRAPVVSPLHLSLVIRQKSPGIESGLDSEGTHHMYSESPQSSPSPVLVDPLSDDTPNDRLSDMLGNLNNLLPTQENIGHPSESTPLPPRPLPSATDNLSPGIEKTLVEQPMLQPSPKQPLWPFPFSFSRTQHAPNAPQLALAPSQTLQDPNRRGAGHEADAIISRPSAANTLLVDHQMSPSQQPDRYLNTHNSPSPLSTQPSSADAPMTLSHPNSAIPRVQGWTAELTMANVDPQLIDLWRQLPHPKLFVYTWDSTYQHNALPTVTKLRNAIANLLGIPPPTVAPPHAASPATKSHSAPWCYIVTAITEQAASRILSRQFWSTKDISFFAIVTVRRNNLSELH
jgi:hypothetical protein